MKNWKYFVILATTLTVSLILFLKLRFTAWPEMILWPYLNIHGWKLYGDIAIAHTPLLLIVLDFIYKVFGVGISQLKIFTWVLILAFDLLIFFVASKFWDKKFAVITMCFFAFWQIFYEGNGLWFDLFMGIFIFASYYFVRKQKWLMVGVFWAIAAISKQTAVWFLAPIAFEIFRERKNILQNFSKSLLGASLILIPFLGGLYVFKILPAFFDWAVKFGIFELPRAQGQIQYPDLKNLAISLFPFTVFIPLFLFKKEKPVSLVLWAIAGMFGAYPRFEYFHFQPAIPFLAIACTIVFTSDWNKNDLVKAFIPVYVLGSLYLFGGFLVRNWGAGTRFYETDVSNVTLYLEDNTNKNDKVFILNYWDNVYALSDTTPAMDPWIPQLSWYMERPGIQDKVVNDLKINKPKIVLLNPYLETGLASYKPQKVLDFVSNNYKLKTTVDGVEVLIPK